MATNKPETQDSNTTGKKPEAEEDYPSGPITCCLRGISRKIRVRDDNTWTVSLLVAWISSSVSLVLFIVAFGTVAWGRAVSEGASGDVIIRDVGLWQECHDNNGCDYITSSTNIGAALKTCQALAVIILTLLLVTNGLIVCYTFQPETRARTSIRMGSFYSKLSSVVLLVILLPVFSTKWSEPKYSTPDYTTSLEYSFDLAVGSFCLELVGLLFLYCETVVLLDDDTKRSYNHARIVEDPEGSTNEGYVDRQGSFPGDGIVNSSRPLLETNLQDRVRGHMNAKKTFENFNQANGNVSHVPHEVRMSQESLFNSKQEIAKRFAGITLAEPAYLPSKSQQSEYDYENLHVHDHQRLNESYYSTLSLHAPLHDEDLQDAGKRHYTGELQTGPDGQLITSVSMYDLHNNSSNRVDADQIQVWHPNEQVQVYRNERDAPTSYGNNQFVGQQNQSRQHNGPEETFRVARIHRAQINHSPNNREQPDKNDRSHETANKHAGSQNPDDVSLAANQQRRTVAAFHEQSSRQDNASVANNHRGDNISRVSRHSEAGHSTHQHNQNTRYSGSNRHPREPGHVTRHSGEGNEARKHQTPMNSSNNRRVDNSEQRYINKQQEYIPQRQRSSSNPHSGESMDTRSSTHQRTNQKSAPAGQAGGHGSVSQSGPRAPARRKLDQIRSQPPSRSHSTTSLHSVVSEPRSSARSTDSRPLDAIEQPHVNTQHGSIPLRRRSNSNPHLGQTDDQETWSTASQGHNPNNNRYPREIRIRHGGEDKPTSHGEPRAPARRRRDQARSQASKDAVGLTPMSRAHSTTSLHSVVSTATTIVDGCAESEI